MTCSHYKSCPHDNCGICIGGHVKSLFKEECILCEQKIVDHNTNHKDCKHRFTYHKGGSWRQCKICDYYQYQKFIPCDE